MTVIFDITQLICQQLLTALDPYQTAVVILVHAFDVLKHLVHVWRHLPWAPGAWASTE